MAKNKKSVGKYAPTRLALFGPAPLLEGEDSAAYDELLARISSTIKPADILEEMWVRDVVDLSWENFRLRRLKSNLLNANAHRGLKTVLESITSPGVAILLPQKWAARDADAIEQVDELLASSDLTMDAVMAETLSYIIDDFERIDRMIMHTEARRNAILREVDRYRTSLGQALRRATNDIENSQILEISAQEITEGEAA
jgi:hypothetical protein